jgi:3-hydroxybutyryl-CoA dehydrogenase
VLDLITQVQAEGETASGTEFSVDRLMMPLLNEAFHCVEEKIANVNDVDMACIAGLGMQVNQQGQLLRMGPLEYADSLGLDVVLAKLEALQARYGERFQPADILLRKVRAGDLGKKTGRGFMEHTVPEPAVV